MYGMRPVSELPTVCMSMIQERRPAGTGEKRQTFIQKIDAFMKQKGEEEDEKMDDNVFMDAGSAGDDAGSWDESGGGDVGRLGV